MDSSNKLILHLLLQSDHFGVPYWPFPGCLWPQTRGSKGRFEETWHCTVIVALTLPAGQNSWASTCTGQYSIAQQLFLYSWSWNVLCLFIFYMIWMTFAFVFEKKTVQSWLVPECMLDRWPPAHNFGEHLRWLGHPFSCWRMTPWHLWARRTMMTTRRPAFGTDAAKLIQRLEHGAQTIELVLLQDCKVWGLECASYTTPITAPCSLPTVLATTH